MKVLLDTHAFLWWDFEAEKLSADVMQMMQDDTTQVFLSQISIWEMQIKYQLGKLTLRLPLESVIEEQHENNHIYILLLAEAHIYGLANLPHHHRDPFDRLLISQAIIEDLLLITNDSNIIKYAVNTFW